MYSSTVGGVRVVHHEDLESRLAGPDRWVRADAEKTLAAFGGDMRARAERAECETDACHFELAQLREGTGRYGATAADKTRASQRRRPGLERVAYSGNRRPAICACTRVCCVRRWS